MRRYRITKDSITLRPKDSCDGLFFAQSMTVRLDSAILDELNKALSREGVYDRFYTDSYPYSRAVVASSLDEDSYGWDVESEVSYILEWVRGRPKLSLELGVCYGERDDCGDWESDEYDTIYFDITGLLSLRTAKDAVVRFTIIRK